MAKKVTLQRALPLIFIICGSIAVVCATIIMYDKLKIAADPSYKPSCSLNPIISCGSVMQAEQAHVFGIPNPFIGLAGFGAVVAIGTTLLAGATKLKRWFWLFVEAGMLFAVCFVHWLFYQSVYSIQALCPWCMVVWVMTITLFLYTTLYNLREGHIKTPVKLKGAVTFVQRHHGDVLAVWLLLILAAILNHFWYYWKTLF
jgi:uncharacterized membrane protein